MKTEPLTGPRLWLLLWRTWHAVQRRDRESIAAAGFPVASDFAVLEVLLHEGPLPVNTIGKKVLLTSGSITSAVDRLEKAGLVRRERDEEDRRVVRVLLTDAGGARIVTAFARHARTLDGIFAGLDRAERRTLAALLRKVRNAAEDGA